MMRLTMICGAALLVGTVLYVRWRNRNNEINDDLLDALHERRGGYR